MRMEVFEGIKNLSWANNKISQDYMAEPFSDSYRPNIIFCSIKLKLPGIFLENFKDYIFAT